MRLYRKIIACSKAPIDQFLTFGSKSIITLAQDIYKLGYILGVHGSSVGLLDLVTRGGLQVPPIHDLDLIIFSGMGSDSSNLEDLKRCIEAFFTDGQYKMFWLGNFGFQLKGTGFSGINTPYSITVYTQDPPTSTFDDLAHSRLFWLNPQGFSVDYKYPDQGLVDYLLDHKYLFTPPNIQPANQFFRAAMREVYHWKVMSIEMDRRLFNSYKAAGLDSSGFKKLFESTFSSHFDAQDERSFFALGYSIYSRVCRYETDEKQLLKLWNQLKTCLDSKHFETIYTSVHLKQHVKDTNLDFFAYLNALTTEVAKISSIVPQCQALQAACSQLGKKAIMVDLAATLQKTLFLTEPFDTEGQTDVRQAVICAWARCESVPPDFAELVVKPLVQRFSTDEALTLLQTLLSEEKMEAVTYCLTHIGDKTPFLAFMDDFYTQQLVRNHQSWPDMFNLTLDSQAKSWSQLPIALLDTQSHYKGSLPDTSALLRFFQQHFFLNLADEFLPKIETLCLRVVSEPTKKQPATVAFLVQSLNQADISPIESAAKLYVSLANRPVFSTEALSFVDRAFEYISQHSSNLCFPLTPSTMAEIIHQKMALTHFSDSTACTGILKCPDNPLKHMVRNHKVRMINDLFLYSIRTRDWYLCIENLIKVFKEKKAQSSVAPLEPQVFQLAVRVDLLGSEFPCIKEQLAKMPKLNLGKCGKEAERVQKKLDELTEFRGESKDQFNTALEKILQSILDLSDFRMQKFLLNKDYCFKNNLFSVQSIPFILCKESFFELFSTRFGIEVHSLLPQFHAHILYPVTENKGAFLSYLLSHGLDAHQKVFTGGDARNINSLFDLSVFYNSTSCIQAIVSSPQFDLDKESHSPLVSLALSGYDKVLKDMVLTRVLNKTPEANQKRMQGVFLGLQIRNGLYMQDNELRKRAFASLDFLVENGLLDVTRAFSHNGDLVIPLYQALKFEYNAIFSCHPPEGLSSFLIRHSMSSSPDVCQLLLLKTHAYSKKNQDFHGYLIRMINLFFPSVSLECVKNLLEWCEAENKRCKTENNESQVLDTVQTLDQLYRVALQNGNAAIPLLDLVVGKFPKMISPVRYLVEKGYLFETVDVGPKKSLACHSAIKFADFETFKTFAELGMPVTPLKEVYTDASSTISTSLNLAEYLQFISEPLPHRGVVLLSIISKMAALTPESFRVNLVFWTIFFLVGFYLKNTIPDYNEKLAFLSTNKVNIRAEKLSLVA